MNQADAPEGIDVSVAEVRRTDDAPHPKHLMLLRERGGDRRLAIWIGPAEATAMVLSLESVEQPRPMPYRLTASLLAVAGSPLREVRITRLTPPIYYATAIVAAPNGPQEVDARTGPLATEGRLYAVLCSRGSAGSAAICGPMFQRAGRRRGPRPGGPRWGGARDAVVPDGASRLDGLEAEGWRVAETKRRVTSRSHLAAGVLPGRRDVHRDAGRRGWVEPSQDLQQLAHRQRHATHSTSARHPRALPLITLLRGEAGEAGPAPRIKPRDPVSSLRSRAWAALGLNQPGEARHEGGIR
jgi:uncharacterized protein